MPVNPDIDPLFEQAAQQFNIDPDVLRAIHLTETGGTGRWDQVSPAGARGGMQFIPSTAAQYGVKNPYDPAQAIPGAARLMSDLLGTYEKQVGPGPQALTMALRGYNAGDQSRWNNPETAAYAGTVAKYYGQLKKQSPQSQASEAVDLGGDSNIIYSDPLPPKGPQRQPMSDGGIAALGALGSGAQQQMAQAQIPSDDELLSGLREIAPLFPKPVATAPQISPQATIPSAAMTTTGGGQGAPIPPQIKPEMVQWAQGETLRRTQAGIPVPPWMDEVASLPFAQPKAAATAAGAGTDVPSSIAKQDNEAAQARLTAAAAPQKRTSGEDIIYPPGSPNAGIAAQGQPDNSPVKAVPAPGGGTALTGAPAPGVTGDYNKMLMDMGKEADAARQGIYNAKLLKDSINSIGTSGPMTDRLGKLDALAQQLGVPSSVRQDFLNLPQGASVEKANAVGLSLLGEVLKASFPQRITNTDIATFKPSSPNADMLSEATNYLIDKSVMPKLWREVNRYGAAVNTDLPEATPQHLSRFLNKWDDENPIGNFAIGAPEQPKPAGASPNQQYSPADIETEMRRRGFLPK